MPSGQKIRKAFIPKLVSFRPGPQWAPSGYFDLLKFLYSITSYGAERSH